MLAYNICIQVLCYYQCDRTICLLLSGVGIYLVFQLHKCLSSLYSLMSSSVIRYHWGLSYMLSTSDVFLALPPNMLNHTQKYWDSTSNMVLFITYAALPSPWCIKLPNANFISCLIKLTQISLYWWIWVETCLYHLRILNKKTTNLSMCYC